MTKIDDGIVVLECMSFIVGVNNVVDSHTVASALARSGNKRHRLIRKQPLPKQVARRHSQRAADMTGLHPKEFRHMRRLRLPTFIFLALSTYHLAIPSAMDRNIDCLDMFAGAGHVSESFRERAQRVLPFEIKNPPDQDLFSTSGFATAFLCCKSLRASGYSMWSIVCSTCVWVCRQFAALIVWMSISLSTTNINITFSTGLSITRVAPLSLSISVSMTTSMQLAGACQTHMGISYRARMSEMQTQWSRELG